MANCLRIITDVINNKNELWKTVSKFSKTPTVISFNLLRVCPSVLILYLLCYLCLLSLLSAVLVFVSLYLLSILTVLILKDFVTQSL